MRRRGQNLYRLYQVVIGKLIESIESLIHRSECIFCVWYSTTCKLPNCLCMGTTPPLGLNANEIPQLVFLTFDDAVADWMLPMYERILARRNPNGCPISMTFYVTHDGGTNYQQVNRYYNQGHEMASHTVT